MNDSPFNPGSASLVLCPDGPILVRGDFDVVYALRRSRSTAAQNRRPLPVRCLRHQAVLRRHA